MAPPALRAAHVVRRNLSLDDVMQRQASGRGGRRGVSRNGSGAIRAGAGGGTCERSTDGMMI